MTVLFRFVLLILMTGVLASCSTSNYSLLSVEPNTLPPSLSEQDLAFTPIIRVDPSYPKNLKEANAEAWVLLEYGINAKGGVVAIDVVDASPKHVFDQEAMRALSKWKYNPKLHTILESRENNRLKTIIHFRIEK